MFGKLPKLCVSVSISVSVRVSVASYPSCYSCALALGLGLVFGKLPKLLFLCVRVRVGVLCVRVKVRVSVWQAPQAVIPVR